MKKTDKHKGIKRQSMNVLPVYKQSFFVKHDREDGLRLNMMYEEHAVYCDMVVDNRFEGYHDVVHGGMLFGILDVIIWYAIFMETKKVGMTRKTEMEFFKPVMCNTQYRAIGKFDRIEDRDIYATAWIEDQSGECYARINALFKEGKDLSITDFLNNFDFRYTTPEIKAHFLSLLENQ
jgi:acyl-coenzyme A thioesterase PaaI-like protein